MFLHPRVVLNLCIACTGTIWMLQVMGASLGLGASPLGYAMLTVCAFNTVYLYTRYRGLYW